MRVFVLEDDDKCFDLIDWLHDRYVVKHVTNIEDAIYYLEYEDEIHKCDKFIFDASVPEATIIHKDDEYEVEFNGALNGVDLLCDLRGRWNRLKNDKDVAVLTAYDIALEEYSKEIGIELPIVISKNDNDLTKALDEFLKE